MEWSVCPFLTQTRLPSANGSSRGMNNIWVAGTRNLQSPQHSQLLFTVLAHCQQKLREYFHFILHFCFGGVMNLLSVKAKYFTVDANVC